jgi:long-chain acyl-CoA synthetase
VTNLADTLTKTAEKHPDRPAVKRDDMVLPYRELHDGARRVASLLADKGVGAGEVHSRAEVADSRTIR